MQLRALAWENGLFALSCWCLVTESCNLSYLSLSYSILPMKELIVSGGFPMFSEIPCSNRDPVCPSNTICAMCVCAQSCPALCDPMDCSPARLLCLWDFPSKNTGVGCHFSFRRFSHPRDQTCISCIAGRFFATEPFGKTQYIAQVRSKCCG